MPRLFVALPVPEHISDALLDTMECVENARWQDADNLHLTLRFIGDVDARLAEDVHSALSQVRSRAFAVEIRGVGHFERKGAGKAIWAAIAPCPALVDLQNSVEMACRKAGLAVETRSFLPHITLARLNRASGPIDGWLSAHASLAPGPFMADHFALYESHLGEGGAEYEALETYPLAR